MAQRQAQLTEEKVDDDMENWKKATELVEMGRNIDRRLPARFEGCRGGVKWPFTNYFR